MQKRSRGQTLLCAAEEVPQPTPKQDSIGLGWPFTDSTKRILGFDVCCTLCYTRTTSRYSPLDYSTTSAQRRCNCSNRRFSSCRQIKILRQTFACIFAWLPSSLERSTKCMLYGLRFSSVRRVGLTGLWERAVSRQRFMLRTISLSETCDCGRLWSTISGTRSVSR